MSNFLSSLFGIGGSSPRTQQVVQTSKLPEEIAPFAEEVLEEAKELYEQRMEDDYTPYTGETIAGFTPEQMEAMKGIKGLRGMGRPYQDEALALTRDLGERFTAETAKEYMSPYQQAVTDIEKRKAMEDYSRRIMPTFEKRAIDAGGMSGLGSRAGVEAAVLGGKQAERLGDIQTKGLQRAYADAQSMFKGQKGREQAQAKALMAQAPARMKQELSELGALQTVGERKQALGQEALDEAYFRHLEKQAYPEEQLAKYSGFVYGNPLMQTRTRTTTSPAAAGPGLGQQLLGLGMTAANIYGQGGGFSGDFDWMKAGQNIFGGAMAKSGGGISSLPVVYRRTGSGIDPVSIPDFDASPYEEESNIYSIGLNELMRQAQEKFDPEKQAIETRYNVEDERKALEALRKAQDEKRGQQATARTELGEQQEKGLRALIASEAQQQRDLFERNPSAVYSAGMKAALAPAADPTRRKSFLGEVIPEVVSAVTGESSRQREALTEKEAALRSKQSEREFALQAARSGRESKELDRIQAAELAALGTSEADRKYLKKIPHDKAKEIVALAERITEDAKERSIIIKNLTEAWYKRSGKGGKKDTTHAAAPAALTGVVKYVNEKFNYFMGVDGIPKIAGKDFDAASADFIARNKLLDGAREVFNRIMTEGSMVKGVRIKPNTKEAQNLAVSEADKYVRANWKRTKKKKKDSIDLQIDSLIDKSVKAQKKRPIWANMKKPAQDALVNRIATLTKKKPAVVRTRLKQALK